MAYQNQLSLASQMLNIYGIFVVKLSICAYLLILDFSPCYKRVIWVSPVPSSPVHICWAQMPHTEHHH
jgi:hypothetical protein